MDGLDFIFDSWDDGIESGGGIDEIAQQVNIEERHVACDDEAVKRCGCVYSCAKADLRSGVRIGIDHLFYVQAGQLIRCGGYHNDVVS